LLVLYFQSIARQPSVAATSNEARRSYQHLDDHPSSGGLSVASSEQEEINWIREATDSF